MTLLNKQYWQQRYLDNRTGWDLGTVSQPIKQYIAQLTDKNLNILIPGAGNAHEASYLFHNGFENLSILDFAQEPLNNLRKQLPELKEATYLNQNYFDHTGAYDIIIEQTFFCALEPRFRESYVEKSFELLNKGGFIVGVLFNFEDKLNGPPFGGSIKEYRLLFESYFDINIMEQCYNSTESRKGKEFFIKLTKRNNGN